MVQCMLIVVSSTLWHTHMQTVNKIEYISRSKTTQTRVAWWCHQPIKVAQCMLMAGG